MEKQRVRKSYAVAALSFLLFICVFRSALAQDNLLNGSWDLQAEVTVPFPYPSGLNCSFGTRLGWPSIPIRQSGNSLYTTISDINGGSFAFQGTRNGDLVDFTITGYGITLGHGGCTSGSWNHSATYSGVYQEATKTIAGSVTGSADYTFNGMSNPTPVTWSGTFRVVVHGLEALEGINPQSDSSFYRNFFPAPKPDQLVSGGTVSSVITADGESRLLLRIIASNPGQVTISESQGNSQQNGSISDLDHYRNASPSSSVSVQLKQYGSQYIGFAVYRAPIDFTIPGYENRLTRPITLNVISSQGDSDIPLTLRRAPIIISHGLWSWPTEEMYSFRQMLWNRFEDRENKNIGEYIYFNNCRNANASPVGLGSRITNSNINVLLNDLRKLGTTVTQVDYLGHSMGGQWGRLVEQYFNRDIFTYDRGLLHKLITLDTPHVGSFVANIGIFLLDRVASIPIYGQYGSDFFCGFSTMNKTPVCNGAIQDLTKSGSMRNLREISVPSHAITGNNPIDTACALVSRDPSARLLLIAEKLLKKINPIYGCENWLNEFDILNETDHVVELQSQKGGLNGNQLSQFGHIHTASFTQEVNERFFDLLNKGVDNQVFATGFPASSTLAGAQQMMSQNVMPEQLSLHGDVTASQGEIQFLSPLNGTIVQPGSQVNVELTSTGSLTLQDVLFMALGSDTIQITNFPYTAVVTVPIDAYDTFVISALAEGTDGNLYSADVTVLVDNQAVLQQLEVAPKSLYLNLGQEVSLSVIGTYSDGSTRNLSSSAQGTTYISTNENILSVSGEGVITPHAIGAGSIQVSFSSVESVIVPVEIVPLYMDADFSADRLTGISPLAVQFTDLSAGYYTNWNWDFGDGTTSTEKNPAHTYHMAGVYTVTLSISGTGDNDSESKTNYLMISAKGDVNGDAQVDLVDAILCLQILSGLVPDGINSAGDVNGDGKIDMAETIYAMQKSAGL